MTPDDALVAADDATAAAALDANFAELIRWYASRPGGEVVEADDVTACCTGLAFRSVNCAVSIDLDPADRAHPRLAAVAQVPHQPRIPHRQPPEPGGWHVCLPKELFHLVQHHLPSPNRA